ncbi:hypothetical protein [Streptomyces sp. NPDC018693]|uniref:hypothetical protein n=1 Tax=unclassified Streptomyces TaxID=2593676 RepID=UPI0037A21330
MPSLPPTMWGQILVDGAWQDLTGVDVNAPMTASRGRSGERSSAGPNQGSMKLINTGARYSRRNPNSPLYELIGLNTPCRYGVAEGSPWVVMSGADDPDAYLSTPSSTALDITGDLDVRVEFTMDDPVNLPASLANRYGTAGNRSWLLAVAADSFPALVWSTDGTAASLVVSTVPLPAMPGRRMALRAVLDVDNGAGGYTVSFYTAKRADAAGEDWRLLGEPTVTDAGTTSVFNPVEDVRVGGSDSVVTVPCLNGNLYRCQLHDSGGLIADLDTSAASPGASSFTDSRGLVWTLNGNSELTNRYPLMYGEISSWEPERNKAGAGGRVTIAPAGISQRLNQGDKPLRSPLHRAVTDPARTSVVAYWPCEDGTDAESVASGIGQAAMTVTGTPTFASDSTWLGSAPLPVMKDGTFTATVASYSVTGQTAFRVFAVIPAGGVSAETSLYRLSTTGTARTWDALLQTDGDLRLRVFDADGGSLANSLINFNATGFTCAIVLDLTQDGADIDWEVSVVNYTGVRTIFDSLGSQALAGTIAGRTVGRVTGVTIGRGGGLQDVVVGHATLSNSLGAFTGIASSALGWNGEGARARFNRLCDEEGITGTAAIDTSSEPSMGIQRSAKLFDLLRQVETVEGGILGEDRATPALAYRGASTMWAQAPVVTLDHSAGLIDAITVKDDTRASFNEVTAKRIGGSEATYAKETGTNSVAAIGRTNTGVNLSLLADDDLPAHAHWRVQQATVDEMRFPQITVDLANERVFAMIDTLYAVDLGDLIRLGSIPDDYGAGDVDLIVVGIKDTVSATAWKRTFICVPGSIWNAGIVSPSPEVVFEDFEDTSLNITITDSGALPWLRTNAQAHTGSWSLRSGAITNNQTSVATVTVPTGATLLAFWYRTSSEEPGPGFEGDRLTVTVDGTQVLRAQGETGWTPFVVDVAGASSVAFTYAKDNSAASGEDAVYIDDVRFTTPADAPTEARIDSDGLTLTSAITATDTSFSVTSAGTPCIDSATSAADFPVDVSIGGEIMTVTAITGTTSPQTFTVVRSANGVVKAHDAGTRVSLAQPDHVSA